MSFLRRFWDDAYAAGDHRRHWEPSGPAPELVELVAEGRVAAPGIAVDLGCGGGWDAIFLARGGFRAVGVDVSPAALAIARRRARRAGVEVAWCAARVDGLPLAAGSAGLVLDRGCFHALGGRARRHYGAVVARLLEPNGLLFLRGSREEREEEGLRAVDRAAVEVLKAAGLAVERERPLELAAPTGDLPGRELLLRRR